MIDINLLNSKRLNDSNCDFFDIDQSLIEKSNDPKSDIGISKTKKQKKIGPNTDRASASFLVIFTTCILLIVGGCFYYQFYHQYKSEISSQNIERTLYYFLDHDSIQLTEFDFQNDGIKLTLKIEERFFNDIKGDIKKHLNRIDSFRDFDLERSGDYLYISYPYFVNILNMRYDENQMTKNYDISDTDNIDKNLLKKLLDDIFKINNSDLINFRINNNNNLYSVSFH